MMRSLDGAGFADAVVLAAGGSSRMNGFDKVQSEILGRPLVAWTVAAVAAAASVRKVILVVRPGQEAAMEREPWVQAVGAPARTGGEGAPESLAAGGRRWEAARLITYHRGRP